MANETTSIRYVARPITIDDGVCKHEMKPGMSISAPHSVNQRDPPAYPELDQFLPDRFLETDAESGKSVPRYGAATCKGRTFAEREIMVLVAAIISLWDISPASGTWKIPAMIPGTGVKKPLTEMRVVITRRVPP
ncbi:hypothetical protein LTR74_002386 [Friedmanniomyces endolithicus]|nr:hypothetical protein LTR74_002386 [Friedmanniomyces endolithicus]